MPSRLFPLIALLCLSSALYAQSEARARYQVYGGYTFLSNSLDGVTGSHKPLNGWDGAVAFPSWHNLRFKIDVAAYRGTNLGAPQHPYFILGGGQYTWRFGRESVFVEGLAGTGGANQTWAANGAQGQTASFASLVGGGLDTPLTRRIASPRGRRLSVLLFCPGRQYHAGPLPDPRPAQQLRPHLQRIGLAVLGPRACGFVLSQVPKCEGPAAPKSLGMITKSPSRGTRSPSSRS